MKLNVLVDWLDRFIPEKIREDTIAYSRARIICGMTIFLGAVLLLSSLRGFTGDDHTTGYLVIVMAFLMLANLYIYKKTASFRISGNYLLFFYFVLLTYVTEQSGGISSSIATNFLLLVILSFLITGLANGIFWGAASFVVLTVMQQMEAGGYEFTKAADQQYYINMATLIITGTIICAIYEVSSAGNLKKFTAQKEQSEKLTRDLQHVLDDTNAVMASVADGDLSLRIQSDIEGSLVELKTSVNKALDLLSRTIANVGESSDQVNSSAGELASTSQAMASGTTQQAASLEEISSSMDEIGSRAKMSNENASQALVLSRKSAEEIDRGNRQMMEMQASMTKINETSTNVSKVVKVIDEIAFQTNLLALNAAVEAARAGKYGKGFSVVAEEVRSLAARSAEAAKDTTELIESSIKEVENGVRNADLTAEILKEFMETIQKVNDLVGEISAASEEQKNGVAEINNGLSQVNEIVQRNSSIAEETASASNELSSQAGQMRGLMASFKIGRTVERAG
ncbi:MAG: methyl-accepting chemotaxis protein, partial [Proteobacteria bacterium]|nr:methyl-accepting chemotaxis protein [Pseudomonadota bacterium]